MAPACGLADAFTAWWHDALLLGHRTVISPNWRGNPTGIDSLVVSNGNYIGALQQPASQHC